MSFVRPTLSEIIARIESDFETRLNTGRLLAQSFLAIMARAYAGAVHLLYFYIGWAAMQLFPDTAEAEFMTRWASVWGVARAPATFADGDVTFTGVDGTVIPEGLRVKRSDGAFFLTTESAVIASGTAAVAVQAVNAGGSGNTDAGGAVVLVNSIAGLNTNAVVAVGGITGGLDAESDESLRLRLLDRIQQPPHGGALFDYVKWAKEVTGVTRAWAESTLEGTVTVRFVQDGESDIIPGSGKVAEVQAYIDSPYRRPATADVTVVAPVSVPLNFTINLSPDTADVRTAVQESLKDLLRRTAEPGGTILISKIREAVSVAAGENDNVVSSPSANVTHTAGQIATFGAITWT